MNEKYYQITFEIEGFAIGSEKTIINYAKEKAEEIEEGKGANISTIKEAENFLEDEMYFKVREIGNIVDALKKDKLIVID